MSITLLEASKLVTDPLQRGVVTIFPKVSPVLERLPLFQVAGQAYRYNQEETLPGVAFRGINASYTESTGIVNPQVESLFVLGGISAVDRALVATQGNVNNLRATYDAMKAKASRERKAFIGILSVALAGLGVDRLFLGSGATGPATASAETYAIEPSPDALEAEPALVDRPDLPEPNSSLRSTILSDGSIIAGGGTPCGSKALSYPSVYFLEAPPIG